MKLPYSRLLASCLLVMLLPAACKLSHNSAEKPDQSSAGHPAWLMQSNVYEVNVRQYTAEGTFKAFEASLPRLKEMGVDILWFMPITPISKVDRKGSLGSYYAVADYKAINPEFGTMADFKEMVQKAHADSFKVVIDWVANHTGGDNGWLTRHPDFYVQDSTGKAKMAADWADTRKLNYDNKELRDSMIDAMKFWLKEADIDGFRCDVANDVPADFWKECIGQLRSVKTIFMLAEGDKPELINSGFDATYSWPMFQKMKKVASGETNALGLDSVRLYMDSAFVSSATFLYFTSNHDENSWNKSDFGTFPGLKHNAFAVFTQTMKQSLPLIYSGQEEPILRAIPFFEKDTMQFGKYVRAPLYKTLLALRKRNPALAIDASFKKVSVGDSTALYAYVREKDGHKIAVILNLSDKPQNIIIKDAAMTGEPMNLFMGVKEKLPLNHSFGIEQWGYVVYEY